MTSFAAAFAAPPFSGRRGPFSRFRSVLGTAALLVGAACSDGAGPIGIEEPAGGDAQLHELVALVNQHRQTIGCGPLALHAGTASVSQEHSEDMVTRNFFGHVNPDGESPFDRLREAGISYRMAGENLASGYPTAQAAFDGWLRSSGHRANLENCSYTHQGLGLRENRWTHMFLAPR